MPFVRKSYEPAYPDDVSGTVQWMIDNAPDVTVEETTWKQNLERVEPGNNTKIKYTRTEVDDRGGEEEIFEFLLTDINPRSLSYEISGNELRISFATNFEAEIIKHYKNGEIQKYAKEVEIVFGEVEMAHNF
ncbi:MAG: hypothetical protein U5L96_13980 [Owenweeksia sp.]|nr:hypothetical protein [Owenweeksia sp.]